MLTVWSIRGKLSELFWSVLSTPVVHSDFLYHHTVFTVCNFILILFCFFVSLYGHGFLSGGKGSYMKFCMRVGLLSGQVFSPFAELWRAESHGGRHYFWNFNELGVVAELAPDNTGGNLELGAVAQWVRRHCLRPLWWDLHLASLLAHLLFFCLF